jgi:hypothetical protein
MAKRFYILGGISLLAIFGGFFSENVLGTELAAKLVVGGAIVGTINVLIEFASGFKK